MANKNISKIVKELKTLPVVQAVYLFGSYARGDATPLSDIDICVITSKISASQRAEILSCASKERDVVLFEDLPFTIQAKIFSEGKPLYVKDKNYCDELRWRTIKQYWDFKPRLKKYIQEFLPGVEYV